MDKWLKDILPDKDPYHNRGRYTKYNYLTNLDTQNITASKI